MFFRYLLKNLYNIINKGGIYFITLYPNAFIFNWILSIYNTMLYLILNECIKKT